MKKIIYLVLLIPAYLSRWIDIIGEKLFEWPDFRKDRKEKKQDEKRLG